MSLMRACQNGNSDSCGQWAQWVQHKFDSGDKKWKVIKIFCTDHYIDESRHTIEDQHIKYRFVGAIPSGTDHTKY